VGALARVPDAQARRTAVGSSVACMACDLRVVILRGLPAVHGLHCCEQLMRLVHPGRCSATTLRSGQRRSELAGRMRVGEVFGDIASGLLVRCTQSGRGWVTVSDRRVQRRARA